ncbi:hypothetical protein GCM10012319_59650 [Comamonas sp. KCTC 72670]|nr:hypothetical protein GCM10012319_59650 [Comamonas sp. KCTC 72670]
MGEPTSTSSCPECRASTAWNAASSTMKGVAPSRWASASTASLSASGSRTGADAPWWLSTAGRGLSVGNSSACGAPFSCCRHQSNCRFSASPRSHSRCHTAKSAYCTGSSGNAAGLPPQKDA